MMGLDWLDGMTAAEEHPRFGVNDGMLVLVLVLVLGAAADFDLISA
jgi:hypothetical protein